MNDENRLRWQLNLRIGKKEKKLARELSIADSVIISTYYRRGSMEPVIWIHLATNWYSALVRDRQVATQGAPSLLSDVYHICRRTRHKSDSWKYSILTMSTHPLLMNVLRWKMRLLLPRWIFHHHSTAAPDKFRRPEGNPVIMKLQALSANRWPQIISSTRQRWLLSLTECCLFIIYLQYINTMHC